ncbi:alanine racemase [Clostridiaceae bacterium 35-E11]
MKDLTRPTWLEINLDNLSYNYREIKKLLKPQTEFMAIVKADAYQHGAIEIVRKLKEHGVKKYGVAHLSEARHLRKVFNDIDILILGYTPEYLAEAAIKDDITLTIYTYDQAAFFSKKAKELDKTIKFHIKIETGMNRLGLKAEPNTIEIIKKIHELPHVYIEGIFTHFPVADEDVAFTYKQADKFKYVCDALEKINVDIPIKHVSNSAAIMNFPDMNFDMVRAGIILYGIYPYPKADREKLKLKSIMTLKAQVSHVKEIEKGERISYGLTYETKEKSKIATLPIGYADGCSRLLSNKGEVIIDGTKFRIVGQICMDQCMVEVNGINVSRGDEAILMGSHKEEKIRIEEIAERANTIPAAMLCMLNKRIPRVYKQNGKIINITDYVLNL